MKELRTRRRNHLSWLTEITQWTSKRHYSHAQHLLGVTVTIVNISSTHWYTVAVIPPGHELQTHAIANEDPHTEFHILDGFFTSPSTKTSRRGNTVDRYSEVSNTFKEWYTEERRRYELIPVGWKIVYHDDYNNLNDELADIEQTDSRSCGVSAIWHICYLMRYKRFAKRCDFSYAHIIECRWALVDRIRQYFDGYPDANRGVITINLHNHTQSEMGANNYISQQLEIDEEEEEEEKQFQADFKLAMELSKQENQRTNTKDIEDDEKYVIVLTVNTKKLIATELSSCK
jgi:hypothetical protein